MANAIAKNGKAMANAITNDGKCYNKNSKVNQTKVNQTKPDQGNKNLKEVLNQTKPDQDSLSNFNREIKTSEIGNGDNGLDWLKKQDFFIPTLENVESLVKHEMLNISPVDWFNQHQAMDWKINGKPIRFWQDVARYHHKKGWSKPNEEKIETGSPVSTRGHFTKHKINEIVNPEQLSKTTRANNAFVQKLLNQKND